MKNISSEKLELLLRPVISGAISGWLWWWYANFVCIIDRLPKIKSAVKFKADCIKDLLLYTENVTARWAVAPVNQNWVKYEQMIGKDRHICFPFTLKQKNYKEIVPMETLINLFSAHNECFLCCSCLK